MRLAKISLTAALAMAFFFTRPTGAQDNVPPGTGVVESLYPNLSSGILMYARVAPLPENILLEADGVEISSKDMDQYIARQPRQYQGELAKYAFFALEQEATGKILLKLAREEAGKNNTDVAGMPDDQIIRTFFENLTKDISISDRDVEVFYKENETMFCGTPLDKIRKEVGSFVLQDKKQRFTDHYIQTVGQKAEILVAAAWVKAQAETARDNLLDKARTNGKPTLAVFSGKSCCGPDKMAPIVEALRKSSGDTLNIVVIEPRREPILSARYGVRSIPTQILYDKSGREYYRNSGLITEKDIAAKIGEMEAFSGDPTAAAI